MKPVFSIQDVESEIAKAILVMRMLPKEGPMKVTSFWPEYLNNLDEDDNGSKVLEYFKPLPQEIDDMDLVLETWLKFLNYEERILVFKRNAGWSWKQLTYKYQMSRSALFEKYKKCLHKILAEVLKSQDTQKPNPAYNQFGHSGEI